MYIRQLQTTDGHLRDVPLEFCPGLNCIIGARGTCKSTIVETIRFVFDDDSARVKELLDSSDGAEGPSHRGLVRATLRGGTARLYLDEDSEAGARTTTVERDTASQPRAYVDGVKAIESPAILTEIEIYSQGDLQEIATSPAKRLALIDRPYKSRIDGWRQQADSIATAIAALGPQIRELREAIDSAVKLQADGMPLRTQLAEVQRNRPAMSSEMSARRAEFQRREQLQGRAREVVASYQELLATLEPLVERFRITASTANSLHEAGSPKLDEIAKVIGSASESATKLITGLAGPTHLEGLLLAAQEEFQSSSVPYYDALKQEQAVTDALKLEDRLATEVATLERVEAELVSRRDRLSSLETERNALRQELQDLRTQIYHRRLDEVERINSEFSDNIVLALNHGTHTERYRARLNEMLAGSRLRDQSALCDQIAAALPPATLVSLVDDEDAPGIASILNRDPGQMMRLISHLSETDDLYRLESEVADDELEITMFVDESPRPVSEMSKGQKATAILPLLLRDAEYPLVLDQPEDDLDNRFIYETLVTKISALKTKRQLIFVTHNANIPVIGEAEKVFVMTMSDPNQAALLGVGSVDQMQDQIVLLLEGGRRAFELRSETYGFTNPTS